MSRFDKETPDPELGTLGYLKPVEVELIAAALQGRDRLMVKVFAWSGLRPSELLGGSSAPGVRWRDIYTDRHGMMRIKVNGGRPKSRRHIVVIDSLAKELEAYRAWLKPDIDDLLFPGPNGGAWTDTQYRNWYRRKWNMACEACGVGHHRVFELRHGYARMLLRSGDQISKVAFALGNGRDFTASRYSPFVEELRGGLKITPDQAIEQARQEAKDLGKQRNSSA